MDFQLASFGDLDQISIIEKETNEYPWTPNNLSLHWMQGIVL